jgi:uncharacterized lipoprotein YajG
MRIVLRLALPVGAIRLALSACQTDFPLSLAYPQTRVAALPGAENVSLDVVGEDKRSEFKDRVGTFRGSYKRFVADNDVTETVRSAVEHGLKDQGFVIAAGGLVVVVELQNFYCDCSNTARASVAFTARARDGGGRRLYSHYYEGSNTVGGSLMQMPETTAANAKSALEQAIGAAVSSMMEDKAMQGALLAAKRQAK